jgi:hypothetical protein
MQLLRVLLGFVVCSLLAGAACMPVHADKPVGQVPVDLAESVVLWNGIWCELPVATVNHEEKSACWTASVLDSAAGTLSVQRHFGESPSAITTLHVRSTAGNEKWLYFLSEEDRVLKGTYLWAIAVPYMPRLTSRPDQSHLLVWFTDGSRDRFAALVEQGTLPGRITDKRDGRSGALDLGVQQTVILGDLRKEDLDLITGDRFLEFFGGRMPFILERLGPAERSHPQPE